MNIAIISPEYPPLTNWGGTATFNASLAKLLDHSGHTVHVITYDGTGREERVIKTDGIYIHTIRFAFQSTLINFAYFTFPFGPIRKFFIKKIPKTIFSFEWNIFVLLAFRALHKKQHFQIIHTPPYSFPALLISLFYPKIRYVFHAHGAQRDFNTFESYNIDNKIIAFIEDYYMRRVPDKIIPCSTNTYKRIATSFPQLKSKLVNIPNFLNIKAFTFKRKVVMDTILFNGQLNYRKGVDILVQAFVHLADGNSQLKLFLVGRNGFGFTHNGYFCDFNTWFAKQKIPQHIRNRIFILSSFDDQNALFIFLQTLGGIVVVPSRYEPFGYVTIEAMALGLPVIATNGYGTKQILREGITGFLFEPTPQSLAHVLHMVIKMDKNIISKIVTNARKSVENRYTIASVEQQYKNLYVALLANN